MENDTTYPVKTTATALHIVEYLRDLDGADLSELDDRIGLSKSTIHRHLSTLMELGYVQKEDGRYFVGFRFLELGGYARNRKKEYNMAGEIVRDLAMTTGERSQFFVEEHGEAVYLYVDTGEHGVMTDARIGKRVPLHATAGGKSILAHFPQDKIERIVDDIGLPALTTDTITSKDELYRTLETIRERGYSYNIGEYSKGSRAVGAPVLTPTGDVLGALSVTGPKMRFQGEWFESELPQILLGSANELELRIEYD